MGKLFNPILDPCPCCGGRAEMIAYQPYDGYVGEDTEYRVRCTACGLEISRDSAREAVEAWKKRTRSLVRAHWVSIPHKRTRICSRCGCDEPYKFANECADVYNFCPNCGADMRKE